MGRRSRASFPRAKGQVSRRSRTTSAFSRPIAYLSAGDFGGDDDGPLTLRAYDCDGSEVAAASAPWPSNALPPFRDLEVRGAAICRVRFTSGGEHEGSAFLDDLEFTLAQ